MAETIKERLLGLGAEHVAVLNESHRHRGHASSPDTGESHFAVTVVAEAFQGQSLPARHRVVYEAVEDLLHQGVHALAITARTPEEWRA